MHCLLKLINAHVHYTSSITVNTWQGVSYKIYMYSTRGGVEKPIQCKAKPSAVLASIPHPSCYISRKTTPTSGYHDLLQTWHIKGNTSIM